MQDNTENNKFSEFYVISDLSELDFLPGKFNCDGKIEYSQTKRWDKSVAQIEEDIASKHQMLMLLDKIDQSLDKIYTLLHKKLTSQNITIPWWKKILNKKRILNK
jgi:hypothetical protein